MRRRTRERSVAAAGFLFPAPRSDFATPTPTPPRKGEGKDGAIGARRSASHHEEVLVRQLEVLGQRRELDRRVAAVAVGIIEQRAGLLVVDHPVVLVVRGSCRIERALGQRAFLGEFGEHAFGQMDGVVGNRKIDDLVEIGFLVGRIGLRQLGVEHEDVLARPARQDVVAEAAGELVVAGETKQAVLAGKAGEDVVEAVADEGVGAGGADEESACRASATSVTPMVKVFSSVWPSRILDLQLDGVAARGLVIEQRAVLHHQLVALEHEASAGIVEQRVGERVAIRIGAADGADDGVGGGVFRDGGGAEEEGGGLPFLGDVGSVMVKACSKKWPS